MDQTLGEQFLNPIGKIYITSEEKSYFSVSLPAGGDRHLGHVAQQPTSPSAARLVSHSRRPPLHHRQRRLHRRLRRHGPQGQRLHLPDSQVE